jgi:YD repeat-containing protein
VYNTTTGTCSIDQQKGGPSTAQPESCDTVSSARSLSHTGPSLFRADPINTSNGNSYQVETDYSGNGESTLGFTRVYNSLDGIWRHSYATYLRIVGNNIALVRADGGESFFTINGSIITASPTVLGGLIKLSDGWQYTAENNERFFFNNAGQLARRISAAGAEQQLSYAGATVTVTDNMGHSLSFTEDALHQPLTLTTTALAIQYSYNANKRLIKLTRTRGAQTEQRTFHYEDSRNNALLTGVTDERGVRFTTWTFDDKGRATSSEHVGGAEHTQITYNADGSSTVTNELGKNTIYRFVSIGGIKRVSTLEGEPSANCPNSNSTFTYDARGLLKTKTDNKGHLTTYSYNTRGLEVSRTEAAGTPQARTITTSWHAALNLPLTVTEPGRVTTYTYDTQGRQLSQTQANR